MKNKIMLSLLAVGAMMLAGCSGGTSSSVPASSTPAPSSQPASSQPAPSSTPAPSSEVKSSEPAPSSKPDPIVHKDPYVKTAPEGAVTRAYNEKFDVIVDDFSSESMKGTLVGTKNPGILRVLVDSENGDFPGTPDASIYKTAAGEFDSAKPDAVGFKLRKIGTGNLKLENLIFACRGNDAVVPYEINLADALNSDNEPLPELSADWQNIEVDFGNTIEDDNTVYMNKDGTPSTVKVLETMIGFHFFAQSNVELSQEIEIAEVYTIKGVDKKVIDCFDHNEVNKNPTFGPYWVDSTGFIIRKGVNIKNGSYTLEYPEVEEEFANVVVTMQGDNSGLTVNGKAPKDLEGNPIKEAVSGAFIDYVINFEKSGIEELETLVIASTSDLNISCIFLTNMKEKEAAKDYPVIDIKNRVIFDSFNRTQATFTDDWTAASTADYTPDPIFVALSYSEASKASVHDGYLDVAEADAYVNVKEGHNTIFTNKFQYMVIVAKGDLTNFRLGATGGAAIWSHDWLAGPGLKSIPEDLESYPYKSGDFVHYIIDLNEMTHDIGSSEFLDMYFGKGMQIDEIYFTNTAKSYNEADLGKIGEVADLSEYAYVGWIYLADTYRLDLTFTGTGSLKSFRFQDEDNTEFWFKDSKVIGLDGEPISKDLEFTAEQPLTISIDVLASGFKGNVHLHSGGFDGSTGNARVDGKRYYTSPWRTVTVNNVGDKPSAKEYSWLGCEAVRDSEYTQLVVSIKAGSEGLTIESLRVEAETALWAKDGKLVGPDGKVIPGDTAVSTSDFIDVTIDLVKSFGSEAPYKADGWTHVHWGDYGESTSTATFKLTWYAPFTAAYEISQYYPA